MSTRTTRFSFVRNPKGLGFCEVCGRPLPDRRGMRGRPASYCPPQPGETVSACARLEKRLNEIRTASSRIIDQIDRTASTDEEARAYFQKLKSYLWGELNAVTNRGKLVRKPKR